MLEIWSFSFYGVKRKEILDHLGKPKFLFDFIEIESHKLSLLVLVMVDLN